MLIKLLRQDIFLGFHPFAPALEQATLLYQNMRAKWYLNNLWNQNIHLIDGLVAIIFACAAKISRHGSGILYKYNRAASVREKGTVNSRETQWCSW